MLVLGIETATLVCGVALLNDERLCGEFAVNVHKTHSTRLLPLIDNLVREAGFTPASLDAVAVSSGPGSFTGLRIGLATAKGISFALGRPLVGVPTLAAVAHNLPHFPGLICPGLRARRGEVYAACYRQERDGPFLVAGPWLAPPPEIISQLPDGEVVFLGDGADLLTAAARTQGLAPPPVPPFALLPRAAAVAQLGWQRLQSAAGDDAFTLTPVYLRPSAAELKFGSPAG